MTTDTGLLTWRRRKPFPFSVIQKTRKWQPGRQKNFLFTLNTTALPVLTKMGAKKAANLFQDLLLQVLPLGGGYSVVIPRKQTCSPCLAYHDFAKAVKSIHDVFLVCFCVSHRKLLLSPTKSIVTGWYCLKTKTGGAVNSGCSPFILLWTNLTNMCCIFLLS